MSKKWNLHSARYIKLANALKLETHIEAETLDEDLKEMGDPAPVLFIQSMFMSIFSLVALVNLIIAIAQSR